MVAQRLRLPEVLLITLEVFGDQRGRFFETWRRDGRGVAGLDADFLQDNVSESSKGVLRGLHAQHPGGQGKLITVLYGQVFDVVVDIRVGSPRWGAWVGVNLGTNPLQQLYVPPGFLHGFVVLSEMALFSYKCTQYYDPRREITVRWDDPSIGIRWPVQSPVLSAKDAAAPFLTDILPERLPSFAQEDTP